MDIYDDVIFMNQCEVSAIEILEIIHGTLKKIESGESSDPINDMAYCIGDLSEAIRILKDKRRYIYDDEDI